MNIVYALLAGILPTLLWLWFWLKEDNLSPEPRSSIAGSFLSGMVVVIIAVVFEKYIADIITKTEYQYIAWATIEEVAKFVAVAFIAFNSRKMDEPIDAMIYCITVALGFAALENILYLFSPIDHAYLDKILEAAITISFIRFIGATFLHTLCSALLGYFLALSSVREHKGKRLIVIGILLASLLHGLYDFSIITLTRPMNFVVPLIIIIGLVAFMLYDFDEIKKVKGICKL